MLNIIVYSICCKDVFGLIVVGEKRHIAGSTLSANQLYVVQPKLTCYSQMYHDKFKNYLRNVQAINKPTLVHSVAQQSL